MSYVLHVWESPAPASVDDATKFIFESDRTGLRPSEKFPAFVAALTAVYPDADTLESRDEDGDDAIWIDSPMDGETDEPVFVVGLRTSRIDDDTVPFIAHTAADFGLFVYDMQGGYLCRPDRTVLSHDGGIEPLPTRRVPSTAPRPRAPAEADIVTHLTTQWAARLPGGWTAHVDSKHPFNTRLWRRHGSIIQKLQVTAGGGPYEVVLGFYLGFDSPEVHRALCEVLPEEASELDRARRELGVGFDHVWTKLGEVFEGTQALHPGSGVGVFVKTMDEVDAFRDRFVAWYAAKAAARLDACRDVSGLNMLLHTEWRSRSGNLWPVNTLFSTLLVIDMALHPGVDFERWVAMVRDQQRRGFASAVESWKKRGSPAEDSYHVKGSRNIDRVIERLQQRRAQRPAPTPKGFA
jgi:hypothetical protein